MAKKIAKSKTLTMRLNTQEKVRTIDQLMVFTNEKTATRALLHAAEDYVLVCKQKDQLEEKLRAMEAKHFDLVSDIEESLSAYGRVMKAIGK